MNNVDIPERLANHASALLAENGIVDSSYQSYVVGNTHYYWWNDEICIDYIDYPHILSLIFDPSDPSLNQGSVYDVETQKTIFVDPDKIQSFAEYLLKLLAD